VEWQLSDSFSIDMPSGSVDFVENCDTLPYRRRGFSKNWEILSNAGTS
jgi:hypothetical protein